jgi:outer membrane protein assembly factor BamB|tara:strand:- start:154 stop:525 length:372 start_codon:yes stop_codon:yes gene_type:complete
MSWPQIPIDSVEKGYRPTLLEADFANQIIRALNILGNIQIDQTIPGGTVTYDDEKVLISIQDLEVYTGTIRLLDADDLTKQWSISIENGVVSSVLSEASPYELKTIEICESGSTASYDFLIKT